MFAKLQMVALSGALAAGSALSAQTPPPVPPPGLLKVVQGIDVDALIGGDSAPANQDPVPAAQGADAAAAAKAGKRLQAFRKLVFDRRPSSVLKAWAGPELKPYDPKEEEGKKIKAVNSIEKESSHVPSHQADNSPTIPPYKM